MKIVARFWLLPGMLVAGLWAMAAAPANAQVPTYTGVEIDSSFVPVAVNASGQLAGNITNPSGFLRAARRTGGVTIDLGVLPGGDRSEATGINASGQVVGNSTKAGGLTHAFVYTGGVMVDMGTLPGGATSYATAINDSGQITGWSDTLQPATTFPRPDHAFLYSGGVMTDLGNISGGFGNFSAGYAINASGQVAGWSVNANFETHAFRYSGGTMSDLGTLGGSESRARGINDSGTVVGWSNTTGGLATHAFRHAGSMIDLGTLAGNNNSSASAINKDGTIVGNSTFNSTPAFVYTIASGIVKLDTMVTGPGWILGRAPAINDAGQIIASGSNASVFATYFLLTPQAVAPAITGQPANKSVTAGQATSFTVAASGTPTPAVQWQLSIDNGGNWNNLANGGSYGGVTSTTLAVATSIGLNGYRYRAIATNTAGSATSNAATLTVNAAPALSIADVSISEGNAGTKLATFTVTLSPVAAVPVGFDISTDVGTAMPGVDFMSNSALGQSIAAGQSSANFSVTINGDTAVEDNETFTVNLNNVIGAGVADGQAQGRIVNDENASLSIADVAMIEGNSGTSTARFVVSLASPMPTPVTFDLGTSNGTATAGSDYVARNQIGRVIDAGRTRVVFEVAVSGDTASEADETFNVTVSNVVGAVLGDGSAVGTIQNDDAAAIGGAPTAAAIGNFAPVVGATIVPQTFTKLHEFTGFYTGGPGGNTPQAGVILSDNTLYGTAYGGGSSIRGTVYKVNANGTGFVVLRHFQSIPTGGGPNVGGANPSAGLILSGNTLFGTADIGGAGGSGTVFALSSDGTIFSTLHNFSERSPGVPYSNSDGSLPRALILSGSTLYGTAVGGGSTGDGTVFRLNSNGTGFTTLHHFSNNSDGGGPAGGMVLVGSTLYGTALNGGANDGSGRGTVFKVNTDGTGFAVLHRFPAVSGPNSANSDGASPYAGLIVSGNTLFGAARFGGSSGQGTVFAINTNGTGFANLHNFTGVGEGADPTGELLLSGATLYGTTAAGGSSGNGTIFALQTNGSGFTTLYSFSATPGYPPVNSDGAHPQAGLFQSGTNLYGTAFSGGIAGNGTVFALGLEYVSAPPAITLQPASVTVTAGRSAAFTVAASGTPTPTLQWQSSTDGGSNWSNLGNGGSYNGVSLATLMVAASPGLSGNQYRCMASNIEGSVASNAATLTVSPTDISIADVSVTEGNGGTKLATFTLSLSPTSATPVSFDIATDVGTALPGVDFNSNSVSGQSIAAGQGSAIFSVTIKGDTEVEGNETFTVNLNNVVGATVVDGQALGIIANDDAAGLSIADVSVAEGNSGGRTATFILTLSSPMPTAVSFDIATGNGTATAGSDYLARSQIGRVLDAGRTRTMFEVTVSGDATAEPDEFFNVTLSNVTGATVADGAALGTIQNDDGAALTPIAQIQGSGPVSPYDGMAVSTEGVVTALTAHGFFIQTVDGAQDGDLATSEGLFVHSVDPTVKVGDLLRLVGQVREVQIGDDPNQLTLSEISETALTVLGHDRTLPRAIELGDGNANAHQSFAAMERFEGMRVSVQQLSVVAPVGGGIDDGAGSMRSNGRFYGVAKGVARPFREPGLSVLDRARGQAGFTPQRFDGNPERLMINSLGQRGAQALSVDSGDTLSGLVGVLGYGNGAYQILPDPSAVVSIVSGASPKAVSVATPGQATIGSVNMRRSFDDSPSVVDPMARANDYAIRLAKTANAICAYAQGPAIVAVLNATGEGMLEELAASVNGNDGNLLFPGSCHGDAGYRAVADGDARRSAGRRLGFLVSTAPAHSGLPRVQVISSHVQGNAANFRHPDASTEPLHSSPPLLMKVRVNGSDASSIELTLLAAELTALDGNLAAPGPPGWDTRGDYLRARRGAQALAIARLIQRRQQTNPQEQLVVFGDFDAAQFNDGHDDLLGVLTGREAAPDKLLRHYGSPLVPPLTNLTLRLPGADRYTETRNGDAVVLSHVLVNQALLFRYPGLRLEVARINADFGGDNLADPGVPIGFADGDPQVLFLPAQ